MTPTTQGHPERSPDHSWTFWRASQPLPDIPDGLPTTLGHSGGPPDHSRTSVIAFRQVPDIQEGLPTSGKDFRPLQNIREGLPDIEEGFPTNPGHLGGPPDNSRTSGRATRPLSDIQDGFPTTPRYPGETTTTTEHPGVSPENSRLSLSAFHHSRTSRRVSRELPDVQEGFPTTFGHLGGLFDYSRTSGRDS